MKNINYRDVMADAKKSGLFKKLAEEARIKMLIADEIYRGRKNLGMDQKKLAELAGTTQRIISNIESGQINAGASLLSRIAKALELSIMFGNANLSGSSYLGGFKWKFSANSDGAATNKLIKDSNPIKACNNFQF